jgi:phenylacetate-CoA ligase
MTLRRLTPFEFLVNLAAVSALMPVYRRREWRSLEEARAWQLKRISALVRRAYEQVPLYHEKYEAAGFRPADLRSWTDFARLPTVTKAELIDGFPDRVIARDTRLDGCLLSTSSGTSGAMMTIAHRADRNWAYALATQRLLRWATGGRYPFWYRQAYIYTSPYPTPSVPGLYPLRFIPTTTEPAPMLTALADFRPHVLTCYPTVLRDLLAADPALMRGLALRGVSVSSEVSTQEERDAWSEALGCPVRDEYSSEELTRIAAQCPAGRYHLMEDIVYTEILSPDGETATDGPGEVVGTELHNIAMPFIRYRQGDLGQLGTGACSCGRPSRLMVALAGRANHGFRLGDGRWLSPGFLLDACYRAIMELPDAVAAYRLVQVGPDRSDFEVVPGQAWSVAAAERLARTLEAEIGSGLGVTVRTVDALPRGPAGKRASIVRLFDQPGRAAK